MRECVEDEKGDSFDVREEAPGARCRDTRVATIRGADDNKQA